MKALIPTLLVVSVQGMFQGFNPESMMRMGYLMMNKSSDDATNQCA